MDLGSFIMQWQLDDKAQQLLLSIEPEQQQRVMSGFNPQDVTNGASRAFMAFARNISQGGGRPGAFAGQTGFLDLNTFVAQWDLDEKAQQVLHNLDPISQQKAVSAFSPVDTSGGASRAFMAFARSISGGSLPATPRVYNSAPGAELDFSSFVIRWELDEKAQQSLLSLNPDQQLRAMSGFSPKDVSNGGASRAFMAFAKNIVAGGGKGESGGSYHASMNGGGIDRFQPYGQVKGKAAGKGLGYTSAQMVKDFIASGALPGGKWRNDERTVFVQGVPRDCTDRELYIIFSPFGAILPGGVNFQVEKGSGLVNYADMEAAAAAVMTLNGTQLPDGTIMKVCAYSGKGCGKN